ncbi:hypothetical protein, partial [Guyparkeria sp.]|uniref:hypothetical protein n=1 Tax=Guyparkeria sp. TaxID=2035736 RepID=UPI003568B731
MPRLVLAGLLVSLLIHAGLLILVNRQPAPEPIEDHAGGGEPMTAQWIELDEAPAAEAAAPSRAERPDTTPPSPLSRPERHQT